MRSSKLGCALLTSWLAIISVGGAQAQQLPAPTSAPALVPAANTAPTAAARPADTLKAALTKADNTVDYSEPDGPRRWYREHILTIQQSTPLIGCWVGGALASRAGSGALLGLATCAAGSVGFSSIGALIDPVRQEVQPSPELDALFSSLPKRDATSAVDLLSGSLDADGRASRQRTLISETKSRGTEIAAMKERKQQNGSIWGQILLGVAQGYLAYETNKGRLPATSSMPSLAGGSRSDSITIYRRDANGQSQGQYQAPLSAFGDATSPPPQADGAIPNANKCVVYKQTRTDTHDFFFSVTNSCPFAIKVRYDVQDGQGFGTWGHDLSPNESTEYYARIGRIVTVFACPARTNDGRNVQVRGSSGQCLIY